MKIEQLPGEFSICRLLPTAPTPESAWCTVRTDEELSVICRVGDEPSSARINSGWTMLRLAGTFDLNEVGILNQVLPHFAESSVPIFVVSTFDTDYILVPTHSLPAVQRHSKLSELLNNKT
jgi:uncharacterized protein